jgi:hypothetical protein
VIDNFENKEDKINSDLEWLKDELKDLTNKERCLILLAYLEQLERMDIGVQEYQAFVKLFNDMGEKDGKPRKDYEL